MDALTDLKAKLAEHVELADWATEGPWEKTRDGFRVWSAIQERLIAWTANNNRTRTSQAEDDADFIASARTLSPLACRGLLIALEAIYDAPRGSNCVLYDIWPHNDRCTCWKKDALARIAESASPEKTV